MDNPVSTNTHIISFFSFFFFFSTREKDVFSISNDGFISVSTTIFTLVLVLYTVLAVQ